jgi:hypothetical protein
MNNFCILSFNAWAAKIHELAIKADPNLKKAGLPISRFCWYYFGCISLTYTKHNFMDNNIENIETEDIEFGGQNQIVNTQEQNREVNRTSLTDTENEDVLYNREGGNEAETAEEQKQTDLEKEKEQYRQLEKDRNIRKNKKGILK